MKIISLILSLMLFVISIDRSMAESRMLSTMEVVDGHSMDLKREKLVNLVSSEKARQHMVSFGVNPDEALKRLASLSDAEVRDLSEQIENSPAGADGGVGTIVGALLLVFIILLITDILGFTKLFPFTRAVN